MANLDILRAALNAAIYQNYNHEISGSTLNTILNSMVDAIGGGYQFRGVATPETNPGTPDPNVFYIAAQVGTYSNFGLSVGENEVALFLWDGTWHKQNTGAASAEVVSQLGQEINGEISSSNGTSVTDVHLWLLSEEISEGDSIILRVRTTGTCSRVIVNYNGSSANRLADSAEGQISLNQWYTYIAPANISVLGLQIFDATADLFIDIKNPGIVDTLGSRVHKLETDINTIQSDGWVETKRVANRAITQDKLAIMEVGSANLLNPNTMVNGYLNINGTIASGGSYETSDFVEVEPNTLYSLAINGNYSLGRFVCEYDSAKTFISGTRQEYKDQITTNTNTKYIRVTYPLGSDLQAQINKGDFFYIKIPYREIIKPEYRPDIFKNDIVMPSKMYMLSGVQNDIFVEPIIKRWRPYKNDVRFGGTATFSRMWDRVASITTPVNNATINTILFDRDDFSRIKEITSVIVSATHSVGSNSIKVTVIGDSIVNGGFFADALIDKGYVPNLSLIGLRKMRGYTGKYDEGRGGWTLNSYFTIVQDNEYFFNPFMQPSGNFRYWGSKQFWLNAWAVHNGTAPSGFEPAYSCGRYDDYLSKFDETTGLLANPASGDIMYDLDNSKFILYNGSSWVDTAENTYTWTFDYSKYLSMWGLATPDIMVWFIGTNDFRNGDFGFDFTQWDSRMEQVIASFKAANANGKFVLSTPLSTCGEMDNAEMQYTARQNALMWEARKHYIEQYDKRESEAIYVVDICAAVDNRLGFNVSEELPYAGYEQSANRVTIQSGVPHPYPNYPTMGIPLAAFIQYIRNNP